MKRDGVISKLKEQRQVLTQQYGVASLFLFGSVARDDTRPDSDVDLLVEFKQPIGLFQFIEVQQKLETTLAGCRREILPPNFGLFFEQKRGIYPLF
ncbi:MAG: nucleotidyltransferase domain-containing protein [Anaerolineaceae bacterium]|nr:nucleotidyltransferase domain-containing protein [Anaerolineaceae bacterium]